MFPWLHTGNSRIFHRMGYGLDQAGIMRRYIRERDKWSSHLEHTKSYILKAASKKEKGKAAVLGSGWLLDVPIVELSEQFNQVWLFDIKHPEPVKQRVRKLPNIKLVETDISGFAIPFYHAMKNLKNTKVLPSLDEIKPVFDFELGSFDFVVSCNILNQLDILIVDYIKRCAKLPSQVEMQIRKRIQDEHMALLPKSKNCMVSDVEELWIDRQNCVERTVPLVYWDKFPTPLLEEWIWYFDNHYTYQQHYNTWFKVVAIEL